jgi:hypothetical protein
MQVVCPGCRQTLTLPPTTGGMGAMICPLCGAGFVPPSQGPAPVNLPNYGAYSHAPMGGIPAPSMPQQQLSHPVINNPSPIDLPAPVKSSSRVPRASSSKKSPIGQVIAIILGGVMGVGAAGYLISRTNFVTQVRQDLGVEKTREQMTRERNAYEKSLDDALKSPVPSTVPSERIRPNTVPSSSGTRESDQTNDNRTSFSKLAGQPASDPPSDDNPSGNEPTRGMDNGPADEEVVGPPRRSFADLIDPETNEPRPVPGTPGKTPSTSPTSPRSKVSQRGVVLPPLDDKTTVDILQLSPDHPFAPQQFRLLSSAAQLPIGGEFVVTPTNDEQGCVVAYKASASSSGSDIAEFRANGKAIVFSWIDGNAADEIREQLRNTVVAYTTPTGVRSVALRKSQLVDRAVLDLEKDRTEWTWTIDSPPKASDMVIEFGPFEHLPHSAEMKGNNELKVGSKGVILFRDFGGAQLTIGSSFKKGEFVFSITPEFVERDGDRFSLAQPRLDEFEKNWEDSIVRNKEKLVQFDSQVAATQALIERIEGSTAANPGEAAAMVAQKRAAAQKIQGIRTRAAATVKASGQLQARLKGLPKVREAMGKLKDVPMPSFVIYAKVGNQRIDLLEHNP